MDRVKQIIQKIISGNQYKNLPEAMITSNLASWAKNFMFMGLDLFEKKLKDDE
jgi:hypothetical protein